MTTRELNKYNRGDLVEVTWRGRAFIGLLIDNNVRPNYAPLERHVLVLPITPNISARYVDPNDISGHWPRRNGADATLRTLDSDNERARDLEDFARRQAASLRA